MDDVGITGPNDTATSKVTQKMLALVAATTLHRNTRKTADWAMSTETADVVVVTILYVYSRLDQ
jgi:hypothetical protein